VRTISSLLLLFTFLCANAVCQTSSKGQDDPWNWEGGKTSVDIYKSFSPVSMIIGLADHMIQSYQTDISPNSISRCPFKISCSEFARIAIARHGLLGFFLFIDRYCYRENVDSFSHYPLVDTGEGTLKLDDTQFLQ
jgi:hypothetical protein